MFWICKQKTCLSFYLLGFNIIHRVYRIPIYYMIIIIKKKQIVALLVYYYIIMYLLWNICIKHGRKILIKLLFNT